MYRSPDPDFEARTRTSFGRQSMMVTMGATLDEVAAGEITISASADDRFKQQHGFTHAGFVTTLLDVACGYAAYTLMPIDAQVLTAEFKVNFLSPATGDAVKAVGTVIKPGRTLMVCRADAYSGSRHVATMQATMVVVQDRPDVVEG